ncbi:hypothetical protein [Arsukibacterium sp. UBA3155]|uniref:hypothetical protein n=1 Tax=Arsukibacterium sp. UBA3155 TaxID=1946058 RepID=UPI0025C5D594|nr:hypothetical protein [Arsukibacterium sp. UBA3155]|tara:strand:- start:58484 stop:60001 length:1518 start_codon:yes stop_codon:yes gene_type:complete
MKNIKSIFWLTALCASSVIAQSNMPEPAPMQTMQLPGNLGLPDQDFGSVLQQMGLNDKTAPVNSLLILLRQQLPQDNTPAPDINWLSAISAYHVGDYRSAEQQFRHLVHYGNTYAMAALASMAELGQGQPANNITALTYFYLAELYDDVSNATAVQKIELALTEHQQNQARAQAAQLAATLPVQPHLDKGHSERYLLERGKVKFGRRVTKDQLFGYVTTRSLISREGKVLVTELIDAMPEDYFEKSVLSAVSKNRYSASSKATITGMTVSSSFQPGVNVEKFNELMLQNDLWQNATQGMPAAQFQLARLLSLAEGQSNHEFDLLRDSQMQPTQPDFSVLNQSFAMIARYPEFRGEANITLDADGKVTKVNWLKNSNLKTEDLLSRSFDKGLPAGNYVLSKPQFVGPDYGDALLTYVQSVPVSSRAWFWQQMAAENGYLASQRNRSLEHSGWLAYLAQQQDPSSLAWFGAQQIIDGDKDAGMANIDKAIAMGYQVGKELKTALKDY